MTKQSHTPTPWASRKGADNETYIWGAFGNNPALGEQHSYTVAKIQVSIDTLGGEAEANAAFIVRACNVHDELVEASVSALAAINAALVTLYDAYGKDGGELTGRINAIDTIQGFKLEIEAALAKAKGE